MAPPAHTDDKKWQKLKALFARYASPEQLKQAGLINADYLQYLMEKQENSETPAADKIQIDAILNHVLGVMLLHHHFIEQDLSQLAHDKAQQLGWVV
jgi:asparagine synthase (glutamine-hydrolysing)